MKRPRNFRSETQDGKQEISTSLSCSYPGSNSRLEETIITEVELPRRRVMVHWPELDAGGPTLFEVLDLSSLAAHVLDSHRSKIPNNHEVRRNFPSDLPTVDGNSSQICQVVDAFLTNASEAIGERTGIITVGTGLLAVETPAQKLPVLIPPFPPSVYSYVRVADSGCGMSEEMFNYIFEPFFTTKDKNKGMGLTKAQEIIRWHRGLIEVKSEKGCGSVFSALLPCSVNQSKPAIAAFQANKSP